MTERVRKIYKFAIKNSLFLKEIYDADKDTKPSMFCDDIEKTTFATIYYGWLVGKFGKHWESHI